MPALSEPKVSDVVGKGSWLRDREDEWEINFEDPRPFTEERWNTASQLYTLPKAEKSLAKHVQNQKTFDHYMREEAESTGSAFRRASLQSIGQIRRPLSSFESYVKDAIDDQTIDTSSLWSMTYLNIKLSIDSDDKLKKCARWLTDLRRNIELFNRCLTQADDENENSMRMEMCEIFPPLLGLLHESVIYLQRFHSDDEFNRNWQSRMEPKVKEYLETMGSTIKHLQSMGTTSKVNKEQALSFAQLGLRDREIEKDGADPAIFPVQWLPISFRTPFFKGRDQEIKKIHGVLYTSDASRLQTYLIYGRRGIGKTQIALEYSRRYLNDYDAIFWVQCETRASLRQSFADIAVKLELDGADKNGHFEENLIKVLDWLKRTRKRWLLIYDNAERQQLLKGYWPVGARGSILLTSRSYYNFFEDEKRRGETVPLFNDEERWELLMAHLGPKWQTEHFAESNWLAEVERASARALLFKTEGLPLAIFHAAKLINNGRIGNLPNDTSVGSFLELFNENYGKLPERPSGSRKEIFKTLETIWSIAFTALNANARALLGVFALLSPEQTLIDLFMPSDQSRLVAKLEFCRAGAGDLVTRPNLESASSPSPALADAIGELAAAGLISRSGREMRIHREVQEAVNYQGLKDLSDSFDAAINLLYDAFPKQESGLPLNEQLDACRLYVQDAISLANRYRENTLDKAAGEKPLKDLQSGDLLATLLSNCAWYLYEIADYDECLNIIDIGRSACEDERSLTYAHLLNTQAQVFYELNKTGPARVAIQAAINIRKDKLPETDPEIANSLANLGNVESAEENLDEALELFQEAAAIRQGVGDKAATMLGLSFLQIGRVHFHKREFKIAYEHYQRAETIFNKKIGRNRTYVADLHYAYGNLELAQEDFIAATRAYELCRRIIMDINPLHPLTSAACYKLACTEFKQEHHKKALNLLDKALNIAYIRSNGTMDGTCARIQWKRAEIILEDPFGGEQRREEAKKLKADVELAQTAIAEAMGVNLMLEDFEDEDREKSFDLLLPGYFR